MGCIKGRKRGVLRLWQEGQGLGLKMQIPPGPSCINIMVKGGGSKRVLGPVGNSGAKLLNHPFLSFLVAIGESNLINHIINFRRYHCYRNPNKIELFS